MTKDTGQILLSLIIWGCTTMFPFYFFSILALQVRPPSSLCIQNRIGHTPTPTPSAMYVV